MILLDTCALLWLEAEGNHLSETAKLAITQSPGKVYVSAASAFEMALKHAVGKLELPLPPDVCYRRLLELHALRELPISGKIASLAGTLPLIHRDPCDRFIIATALNEGMPIITADRVIPRYPDVNVIW